MKARRLVLPAALTLAAFHAAWAQVTFDRILHADREPQNWLTYSGTFASQRFSALNQIGVNNVGNLELQWVFQARSLEKFEATPLVVDGVMYTVQAPNDVVALDAATGGSSGRGSITRRRKPACAAVVSIGDWRSWATRSIWEPSTPT